MFMINKILPCIICTVLALIILYTGVSCIATWHKASTQPYLVSGTARFYFLGFYIMAAAIGAVCIVTILILVFVLFRI